MHRGPIRWPTQLALSSEFTVERTTGEIQSEH